MQKLHKFVYEKEAIMTTLMSRLNLMAAENQHLNVDEKTYLLDAVAELDRLYKMIDGAQDAISALWKECQRHGVR